MSLEVAVFGSSGYAGEELCRLLRGHPSLTLASRLSVRREQRESSVEAFDPSSAADCERLAALDAVFFCTPHGVTAPLAKLALDLGLTVVDLSADFRLRDAALWSTVYGREHAAPELCDAAVYGLTEHARPQLSGARLVANPGCYPTAVLLPLLPLIESGLLNAGIPVIADCKSGVSGAGRAANDVTHFGNVHENFRAYGIGSHRHAPEIAQGAEPQSVVFVPHLLPCFRGILATLYLQPVAGADFGQVRAALQEAYDGEALVRVLVSGTPALADVQRTNRCEIGVAMAGETVVVVSAIDNLLKGAASQAIQNMNLALGLAETEGLG